MNDQLIPSIAKAGVKPVNPWDEPEELEKKIREAKGLTDLRDRRVAWEAVIDALGQRNAHAIENADGVVAVLDGSDVDSGTAAEIGYATALGKWVIGYREDFRQTGEDPTAEVNLQVEYFIRKHRGVIAHSLPELAKALQNRHEQKGK